MEAGKATSGLGEVRQRTLEQEGRLLKDKGLYELGFILIFFFFPRKEEEEKKSSARPVSSWDV